MLPPALAKRQVRVKNLGHVTTQEPTFSSEGDGQPAASLGPRLHLKNRKSVKNKVEHQHQRPELLEPLKEEKPVHPPVKVRTDLANCYASGAMAEARNAVVE